MYSKLWLQVYKTDVKRIIKLRTKLLAKNTRKIFAKNIHQLSFLFSKTAIHSTAINRYRYY